MKIVSMARNRSNKRKQDSSSSLMRIEIALRWLLLSWDGEGCFSSGISHSRRGRTASEGRLFGGPMKDDANFFQSDQAAAQHFIQLGKNLLNPFGILDHLDNDGQVFGKAENRGGMVRALTETG